MKKGSIRIEVPSKYLKRYIQTQAQKRLIKIVGDKVANDETKRIYLEMSNKYVPKHTGALIASGHITPKGVVWSARYSHYMYEGIVYGPNYFVPLTKNADGTWNKDGAWGWRSPPGEGSKYPTNRTFKYASRIATSKWDKTMLRNDQRAFNNKVTWALKKRAGEI